MNTETRGTLSRRGNISQITNAFVEEVNAVFSSAMTRSIPPQANAFLIMVQKRRPQIEIATSIGRIASIDAANGFLYTGNPNDINSQVRYVVSNSTFSDPSGRPITLSSLRPSQRVRITHATAQTASIPPQTIAFHVLSLIHI